jgi:MFS family permease
MHQDMSTLVIPPLIRRNIALFALSQSFTGAGIQFAFGFGPLMVIALTGSASLSGIFVGLIGLSRFLVSYPIGRITDRHGRKPGIQLGLALALAGAIWVGIAMALASFAGLVAGVLLFGMGYNASQQLRVAATDMVPPQRRAEALGYVALGTVVGLVLSPLLASLAERIAASTGAETLALPWLLLPPLMLIGMVLVALVRPDPMQIGGDLGRYYPGLRREDSPAAAPADFSTAFMLRDPELRLALVANAAAQGNMSIVMVLISLVLASHGHSLTAIAFAQLFHSAGMFAFTIPLGRLSDRSGHKSVMLPGVALALVGAAIVAFTADWWSVTLGAFLVGLGWAAANVAATALIADRFPTAQRGRAIGINESAAGATSVAMALVTGPLLEFSGLPATGLFSVLVALPPLLLWLAPRLRRDAVIS